MKKEKSEEGTSSSPLITSPPLLTAVFNISRGESKQAKGAWGQKQLYMMGAGVIWQWAHLSDRCADADPSHQNLCEPSREILFTPYQVPLAAIPAL